MADWKTDLLPAFLQKTLKKSEKDRRSKFKEMNQDSPNPDLKGIPKEMNAWNWSSSSSSSSSGFCNTYSFPIALSSGRYTANALSKPQGYYLLSNTLDYDEEKWYAGSGKKKPGKE